MAILKSLPVKRFLKKKWEQIKHQKCYHKSENDRCKSASDETFPSLLWRKFNERSFTEEEAEHVSHNVITNNHRNGNDKPENGKRSIVINFSKKKTTFTTQL